MNAILVCLFVFTLGSLVVKDSEATGVWLKANSSPVCFGAKSYSYGRFYAPSRGRLASVKLVHLYGYVSCNTASLHHWSFWGCGTSRWVKNKVNVVITTSSNHIVLPPRQFFSGGGKWSYIPGYNSHSPEIILSFFSHPYWVYKGRQFRVWYGEDLVNYTESDNGGKVCADVYALYV
ncbi:hypothetical protein ACROYT_G034458 [Oculina patagonica]